MTRPRILSLSALALVAAAAFTALSPDPEVDAAATPGIQQGVAITSLVEGTTADGAAVSITLNGLAAHTLSGQNVVFFVKQLTEVNPGPLGPFSASLDPGRASTGTLSSTSFPTQHRQDFFLRIKNSKLGTLVSDLPLTVSASIQSSPPTATYSLEEGGVVFYQEGDPNKQPVLTVQNVTSSVQPAASQSVNISSLVTASIGTSTATVQFVGSASNLLSGTNVLFTAKQLTAVNPGLLGPTTVALDTRQPSAGTLSSETFPADHTQDFFLQIESANLGTLVADLPVTLTATIQSCPPVATYRSISQPVRFYRLGDPSKQTVLTIHSVTSDVMPPPRITVFFDDFEADLGWIVNPNGTDTATTGQWERGDPETTSSSGTKQLGTTVSGVNDLVTGRLAGSSAGVFDLDGGVTSILSPAISLPAEGTLTLSLSYYLAHASNSSSADFLRVSVVGSTTSQVFQELGAANDDDAVWATTSVNISSFAGQTVRILIEAADASAASLVEAAVDDVRILQQP